ncbi:MAG: T9SS type A sorting domain-containing protein [Bacteroidota bacterium]
MRKLFIAPFFFLFSIVFAQPVLKQSIGIGPIPNDTDPVCYAPWYLGSFYSSGLQAGDTAYDFTIYNLNGDSLNLRDALSHGRPVLLVAGSYTCPVYRGKVPVINDVFNMYAGQLDVYIIYTLEAHPEIDTSVYFGYVNTTTQNNQEGILYRQPTTYGERKMILSDMLTGMNTLPPVFIDGPCNNWWSNFGPAPNNSYLIDTTGIIYSKHGWFDRYPDNIYCAIDSLLGTNSGNCTAHGGTSNYSFQLISADTVYGLAGSTISVDAALTNTGTQDILIHAQRIANDLPAGWASSMCIDVCYSSATDSVVFLLPAGATQPVHVYFYTSSAGNDTGHVKMGFKNLSNAANNNFMQTFGITTSANGIHEIGYSGNDFSISPNPAHSELKINIDGPQKIEVQVYNSLGKCVLNSNNSGTLDISNLSQGIYFVKIRNHVKMFLKN